MTETDVIRVMTRMVITRGEKVDNEEEMSKVVEVVKVEVDDIVFSHFHGYEFCFGRQFISVLAINLKIEDKERF